MAEVEQTPIVFPIGLRDIYPLEAQQLYIQTYKQTMEQFKPNGGLSREGAAARDAWDAVRREFVEDPETHKWYRKGEPTPSSKNKANSPSIRNTLKGLFKR
jgi:cation transport regulator ChaB